MDNVVLIIVTLLSLVLGLSFIFKPIPVLKVVYVWPKAIFSKITDESNIRPRVRQAVAFINNDIASYEKDFPLPILSIRLTGFVFLGIFSASLCILFSSTT